MVSVVGYTADADAERLLGEPDAAAPSLMSRRLTAGVCGLAFVAIAAISTVGSPPHAFMRQQVGSLLRDTLGLNVKGAVADTSGDSIFSAVAEEILHQADQEKVLDELVPSTVDAWEVVYKSLLNVRKEPDTKAKVLGTKHHGEWIYGEEQAGGWVKLAHEAGYVATSMPPGTELLKKQAVGYMAMFDSEHRCEDFGLKHVVTKEACQVAATALDFDTSQVDVPCVQRSLQTFLGSQPKEEDDSAEEDSKGGCYVVHGGAVMVGPGGACGRRLGDSTSTQRLICANLSQPVIRASTATTTSAPMTTTMEGTTMLTETNTTTTEMQTTTETCDSCMPRHDQAPTVVIPFYEHDICKLLVTAKSISVFDTDHVLGDINLMWISHQPMSNYADQIREIEDAIRKTHKVYTFDFHPIVGDMLGWRAQQVLKLKIAGRIYNTDYYIVLDSKNTFIKKLTRSTFFASCGRARTFGRFHWYEIPGLHAGWYRESSKVLGVDAPKADDEKYPTSITPMVLHRETVLDMLRRFNENTDPTLGLCMGDLCKHILAGATEFTLYQMYARRIARHECIHYVQPVDFGEEPEASLWRGEGADASKFAKWNVQTITRIADGMEGHEEMSTIVFGAQADALNNMNEGQHYKALEGLSKIYQGHGLYDDTKSWDDLATCVA